MLSGYVDVGSVLLGIILTQLIRYLLTTPKGSPSKFDVGPVAYRFLPFFPLFIGAATVILKDGIITPTIALDEAIVKGFISGACASYLYRMVRVTIFGKASNGNGNGNGHDEHHDHDHDHDERHYDHDEERHDEERHDHDEHDHDEERHHDEEKPADTSTKTPDVPADVKAVPVEAKPIQDVK